MPELRWTLLIVGVVFVVALAWWERRRPHQASRHSSHEGGDLRPVENDRHSSWDLDKDRDSSWGLGDDPPPARVLREPTLTLPEIRVREPSSARELPVVEIGDDELPVDLHGAHGTEAAAVAESRIAEKHERDILNTGIVEALRVTENADIETMDMEPMDVEPIDAEPAGAELEETTRLAHDLSDELRDMREDLPGDREDLPDPRPSSSETVAHEYAFESGQVSASHELAQGPLPGSIEPIVEWPPDDVRKIVAQRLVAPQPERVAGRAVRRALAAEGFVLGKFSIFHKPDLENRAFLSAASLNKPGTFDLETIDTQRFGGLNLFAVLPGPKTPHTAFEELLTTARSLNERLQGALQDERGSPLTAARISALRDGLGAEASS